MVTKMQNYIQIAGETAAQVTKKQDNWTNFLDTASRLYQYSFTDQLMIYAQRPKAAACAEFDLWTKRMKRHIRHGFQMVGLVAINRNDYPKIWYVFDVKDTELKKNSASLFQCCYKEEYYDVVTKALEKEFGVS